MTKTGEFIAGQRDCKNGKPARKSASKEYLRGYGFQYELEAIQSSKEFN